MSLRALVSDAPPLPPRRPALATPPEARRGETEPIGPGAPLTAAGFEAGRALLGLEPAALWAVMRVEARGCGFLPDRRPVVLYERHVFHRRTRGRHSLSHPALSDPKPGGYGAPGAAQHARLDGAIALDREAALESASWGLGQVMGFNARVVGFGGVEAMVSAMRASEDAQLLAFCTFIAAHELERALRARDWRAFARGYNGPAFARNAYDTKLAAAFDAYASGTLAPPDLAVREVQMRLIYAGHHPGAVDGLMGRRTRAALAAFRIVHGEAPEEAARRPLEPADRVALAAVTASRGGGGAST